MIPSELADFEGNPSFLTEVPAELEESVDCSNIQLPNFITANLKVILKNINDEKKRSI